MPGYKVHQLTGIGFVFVAFLINSYVHFFALSLGIIEVITVIGVTLFYSILPDVDIGTSKSRKLVLGGGLLLIIYCFLTSWAVVGVAAAIMLLLMIFLLKHRGKTHSPLSAIIFSVPLLYVHWVYALMGLIAYLSHLIADGELKWK